MQVLLNSRFSRYFSLSIYESLEPSRRKSKCFSFLCPTTLLQSSYRSEALFLGISLPFLYQLHLLFFAMFFFRCCSCCFSCSSIRVSDKEIPLPHLSPIESRDAPRVEGEERETVLPTCMIFSPSHQSTRWRYLSLLSWELLFPFCLRHD